jgi:hypothetical protein
MPPTRKCPFAARTEIEESESVRTRPARARVNVSLSPATGTRLARRTPGSSAGAEVAST